MFKIDQKLSHDHSQNVTDEKFNTVSHMAAAMLTLAAGALLFIKVWLLRHDFLDIFAVTVYAVSVFALFALSTLHHGVSAGRKTMSVLRTLDYAAVFTLIAGTVTAVCILAPRHIENYAFLGVIWLLAAAGIALRASISSLPKYITSTMYITLGWMPTMLLIARPRLLPFGGVALLALGGMFYTAGFIIYNLEKPNPYPGKIGFHEIWHCLVIAGVACHFLMIYYFLAA